jgi:hypothetical protein
VPKALVATIAQLGHVLLLGVGYGLARHAWPRGETDPAWVSTINNVVSP